MDNKILDIIVPVYGKEPKFVFENLLDIKNNVPFGINLIIVYKNSSEYNYDLLKNLISDSVTILEADINSNKTDKLLIGLKSAKSKFIMTLDAHHSLKFESLPLLLKFLTNTKSIFITMTPIEEDVDSNTQISREWGWLNAGRYIISNSLLKSISSEIKYSITFCDDLTFPLFAIKEIKNENEFVHYTEHVYIKRYGKNISNTTLLLSNKLDGLVISSLEKILYSTSIYFGENELFDKQFLTLFWYYILRLHKYKFDIDPRKVFTFTQENIDSYWNLIFKGKNNTFLNLAESIGLFSNWIDVDLKIFSEWKISII